MVQDFIECILKEFKIYMQSQNTEAEIELFKLELCKRFAKEGDILNWGKLMFPEKFYLPFCEEIHQYFVDIKDVQLSATLAPRNSAKTTIRCFLIPIFLGLNRDILDIPYDYFLNVQNTATKAININISIKYEIETNPYIQELYGDQINSSEKWTEKLFILKNGTIFNAISAGESVRGLNVSNKRPDYMIIDDIYDKTEDTKLENILKKNSWFWEVLYLARAKTKSNCIHIQGTAFHKEDLLHKATSHDDIVCKKFQGIKDFDKKIVTWPALGDFESLMSDKEKMGSYAFNREIQNDITNDEDSYIKEKDLRYFDDFATDETIVDIILAIDPSIGKKSDKTNSDPTGMAVVYKTVLKDSSESYRWYIKDVINERLSFQERINTAKSLHHQYNFKSVIVESISGFADFSSELRRLTNLPIKEIKSVPDKITNLGNNQAKFENHKVFIYNDIELRKKQLLIEQLVTNYPTHDDMRDAVLLALNHQGNQIHFWK